MNNYYDMLIEKSTAPAWETEAVWMGCEQVSCSVYHNTVTEDRQQKRRPYYDCGTCQ